MSAFECHIEKDGTKIANRFAPPICQPGQLITTWRCVWRSRYNGKSKRGCKNLRAYLDSGINEARRGNEVDTVLLDGEGKGALGGSLSVLVGDEEGGDVESAGLARGSSSSGRGHHEVYNVSHCVDEHNEGNGDQDKTI